MNRLWKTKIAAALPMASEGWSLHLSGCPSHSFCGDDPETLQNVRGPRQRDAVWSPFRSNISAVGRVNPMVERRAYCRMNAGHGSTNSKAVGGTQPTALPSSPKRAVFLDGHRRVVETTVKNDAIFTDSPIREA